MMQYEDLTPQGRAARITYLLVLHHEMSTQQIAAQIGLKNGNGIRSIMDNISVAGIPLYQPEPGFWAIDIAALPNSLTRDLKAAKALAQPRTPDEIAAGMFDF